VAVHQSHVDRAGQRGADRQIRRRRAGCVPRVTRNGAARHSIVAVGGIEKIARGRVGWIGRQVDPDTVHENRGRRRAKDVGLSVEDAVEIGLDSISGAEIGIKIGIEAVTARDIGRDVVRPDPSADAASGGIDRGNGQRTRERSLGAKEANKNLRGWAGSPKK